MHEYEFITIEELAPSASGKTQRFSVRNKRSGDLLGLIQWHGPWRQYTFHTKGMPIFSAGCMTDIATFIVGLNHLHRNRKKS